MSSRADGPNTGPSRLAPLAGRADHRGAGDDHRAGPAVVADRQVLPVRQQRRLAGPEDLADVGRVVLGGVEVDVVAPPRTAARSSTSASGTSSGSTAAPVRRVGEQLDDPLPDRRPLRPAQRHEVVERGPAQRAAGQDQPGRLRAGQVEHEVPDPYADPRARAVAPEHPVRQVVHPVRRALGTSRPSSCLDIPRSPAPAGPGRSAARRCCTSRTRPTAGGPGPAAAGPARPARSGSVAASSSATSSTSAPSAAADASPPAR